jgi:small subunit ribosomal protein S21
VGAAVQIVAANRGLLRPFLVQPRDSGARAAAIGGRQTPGSIKRHSDRIDREEQGVQVLVRDNNVDQALKALKKKMQREGIFREMKLRGHYEKPSTKKAREKAEAIRRARKLARKRAQREGLLPGKPKTTLTGRPGAGGPGGRGGAGPRSGGFGGAGGGFGGGGGGGFSRGPR